MVFEVVDLATPFVKYDTWSAQDTYLNAEKIRAIGSSFGNWNAFTPSANNSHSYLGNPQHTIRPPPLKRTW